MSFLVSSDSDVSPYDSDSSSISVHTAEDTSRIRSCLSDEDSNKVEIILNKAIGLPEQRKRTYGWRQDDVNSGKIYISTSGEDNAIHNESGDQLEPEPKRTCLSKQLHVRDVLDRAKQPKQRRPKDRVKEQRLKGQSGIGAEFRTWKSETEMRLRQQYD